MDIPTSFSS